MVHCSVITNTRHHVLDYVCTDYTFVFMATPSTQYAATHSSPRSPQVAWAPLLRPRLVLERTGKIIKAAACLDTCPLCVRPSAAFTIFAVENFTRKASKARFKNVGLCSTMAAQDIPRGLCSVGPKVFDTSSPCRETNKYMHFRGLPTRHDWTSRSSSLEAVGLSSKQEIKTARRRVPVFPTMAFLFYLAQNQGPHTLWRSSTAAKADYVRDESHFVTRPAIRRP